MPLILVDPPGAEPISAADARSRLSIPASVSNASISSMIKSARQKIEKQYGVAMVTQTWRLILDRFPGSFGLRETGFHSSNDRIYRSGDHDFERHVRECAIDILLTPLQEDAIQSVKYLDASGTLQPLDPSSYTLQRGDLQSSICLSIGSSWPSTAWVKGCVTIEFEAGFGDASDVPDTMKQAILLRVAHLQSLTANNLFLSLDRTEGVGEKRYVVGPGAGDVIAKAIDSLMQEYFRPSL